MALSSSNSARTSLPSEQKSMRSRPSILAQPNQLRASVAVSAQAPRLSMAARASIAPGRLSGGARPPQAVGRAFRSESRPIDNKQWQAARVQEIAEWCHVNHYPTHTQINAQSLGVQKEYCALLQFMWNKIDPSYQITNPENDVPALFAMIKYPIAIKKSSIKSIGAPVTWPTMLAALAWMRDTVDYDARSQQIPADSGDATEADNAEMLFQLMCPAYAAFLGGQDDFEAMDRTLAVNFSERIDIIGQETSEMRAQIDALSYKLSVLQTEERRVDSLADKHQRLRTDIAKFETLLSSMEAHKAAVVLKSDELHAKMSSMKSELTGLMKEQQQLRSTLAQQEATDVDGERMAMEKAKLDQALQQQAEKRERIDAMQGKAEIEMTRRMEDVQAAIKNYNSMAVRLDFVPCSARLAKGRAFEVNLNSHAPKPTDMLTVDLRGSVLKWLNESRQEGEAKLGELQAQLDAISEKLDALDESLQEKKDELEAVDEKLKRADEASKEEKRLLKEYMEAARADTDDLEAEAKRLRAEANAAASRSKKSKEALKIEYEQLQKRLQHEKEQYCAVVLNVLESLMSHKASIQEQLENLKQNYTSVHQQLQSS